MYMEKLKLDGRVAVVTGGGQGIGFACAQALGEAGATVVVAEMMPDRVKSSVAALEKLGLKASGVTLDVTKSKDVDKAAAEVIEEARPRRYPRQQCRRRQERCPRRGYVGRALALSHGRQCRRRLLVLPRLRPRRC